MILNNIGIYIVHTESTPRTLGRQDAAALQTVLQHPHLEYGRLLYEAGQRIEFVYSPLTGVISLVKNIADGSASEVGTVGNEGVVGVPMLVGERAGGTSAHMQIPGAGPIDYRRGQVTITDRAGLEKRSCECYRSIWDEYDRAMKASG